MVLNSSRSTKLQFNYFLCTILLIFYTAYCWKRTLRNQRMKIILCHRQKEVSQSRRRQVNVQLQLLEVEYSKIHFSSTIPCFFDLFNVLKLCFTLNKNTKKNILIIFEETCMYETFHRQMCLLVHQEMQIYHLNQVFLYLSL